MSILHFLIGYWKKSVNSAGLLLLLLLCWLVPIAHAQVHGQQKPILIRLKTELTRAQLSAGHVPMLAGELNGWNPADSNYRFIPSDGYWWLRLAEDWDGKQYKLTLGSWDRVEINAMGSDVGNREIRWRRGDTIKLEIPRWKEKTETVKKRSTASKNVKKFYFGDAWHRMDTAWVWLPKAYDPNSKKRWPVIYALDGANLFDDSTAFNGEWHLDEIMDAREKAGKPVAIVIGLVPEDRVKNYTMQEHPKYGGGGAVAYLSRIIEENWSVNHRKITLNITSQAKHTYIIGSSLGGLFASYFLEDDNIQHISRDYKGYFFGGGLIYSPAMWFEKEADAYRIEMQEATRQAAERLRLKIHVADSIRKIGADEYIKNRKIELNIPLYNTDRDSEFLIDFKKTIHVDFGERLGLDGRSSIIRCPSGVGSSRTLDKKFPYSSKRRIVVLAGGQESSTMVSDAQALVDKLKLDPKAEVKFVIDPEGRHNERFWSKYLSEHLDYLLGAEAKVLEKKDKSGDEFLTVKLKTNLTKKQLDAGYVPYLTGAWNNWKPNDPDYKFVQKNGSWYVNIEKDIVPGEIALTLGSWNTLGFYARKGKPVVKRVDWYNFLRDTNHLSVPIWGNPKYYSRRGTASKRVKKLLFGKYIVNNSGTKDFVADDSVWVWLPKSYDPKSEKRWPVIFASDGMNLFDDQTSSNGEWHLDEIMDAREKKGKPVAIVIGLSSRTIDPRMASLRNWSANHLNLKINISDSARDRYLLAAKRGAYHAADFLAKAVTRDFNSAILYDPTPEYSDYPHNEPTYEGQHFVPCDRIVVLTSGGYGLNLSPIRKLLNQNNKQSGAAYKQVQDPAPVRDERLWSKYLPEHLDYLLGTE